MYILAMGRFNTKDYYFDKAKAGGFKARSVFKLEEIDRSLKIIQADSVVIDLGCSPGSWLQYVAEKIGPKGAALGIDLTEINDQFHPRIKTVQGDCFALGPEQITAYMVELVNNFSAFDVVLSDMAPKTTGIKHVDQTRSLNLAERAVSIAEQFLKPGGHLVVKIFASAEVSELIYRLKRQYKTVKQMRPESIRSASKEFYVVGLAKK